jgi:lipopolysaccharide transport system permease protein
MTKSIATEERVIKPQSGLIPIDFPELWRYRELIVVLAWRNILIRYKQTYLGILWALIQPLLVMIVMTVVFGKVARMPDGGAPYAVLAFAAILPWQFFGSVLTASSNSLVDSQSLITKIYFPRLALPISAVLGGSLDFFVSLGLLAILMIWYAVPITPNLLALPFFFLLTVLAALSLGIWLSALSVKYRDVSHIVPFIVRFGLYASPVGFMSASLVPRFLSSDQLPMYYTLNPLVGILEGFRWCILGDSFAPLWSGLWTGGFVITIILVSGAFYFRSVEATFADDI